MSAAAAPYEIGRRDGAIHLEGELRMANAAGIWRSLRSHAEAQEEGWLDIDLSGARVVDGAVMSLLVELRSELEGRGVESEIVGADERVLPLVHLYGGDVPPRPRPEAPVRTIGVWLGRSIDAVSDRLRRSIQFIGELSYAVGGVTRRPSTGNWRSVLGLSERAGADGVVIVLLLNFLVGIVLAYQSAEQLKLYGANIYVADAVGISVTRELGPLITAIIMSGRSGAAYAAELGTMKVSEELDALHTMGFVPVRHLVIPRVLALFIVTPLLTLIGDVSGVLGGALIAVTKLDVTAYSYLTELRQVVVVGDVVGGLVKSSVAGLTIAMIGSQQGFATCGGPAGVGIRTTSTVVKSLVALVLIDAFFAVLLGAIRR